MLESEECRVVAVAKHGYPPDQVYPLLVSVHGDHAVVILETGTSSHSYPYCVVCCKVGDHWVEQAGSNMPGWYQVADDDGVIVFWEDLPEIVIRPLEIAYANRRFTAHIVDGYACAIIWGELDPDNLVEPQWPALATQSTSS